MNIHENPVFASGFLQRQDVMHLCAAPAERPELLKRRVCGMTIRH